MRKLLCWILICAWIPVSALAGMSDAALVAETPVSLQCASAILVEANSGQIIFAENADEMRPVASVTKLMTILLTLEALQNGRIQAEEPITVSKTASGMGGSQILLDTGETQTCAQLLKSVIVGSANDAAVALAEYLYGSETLFVAQMNTRAQELGMTHTHFLNCTGLPADGQYTTARDVAQMALQVFSNDQYYPFSNIWLEDFDHFDGRVTQLTNTNKLLRMYDGCDGGKTGSTKEAGYCIAATAQRNSMRLIAVVLGSSTSADRFETASAMFDYGFATYRLYPVAQRGTSLREQLPVIGGSSQSVPLVLGENLTLLLPKGTEHSVQLIPHLPESVTAPVEQGAAVGNVEILQNGELVASLPIQTAEAVTASKGNHILRILFRLWLI